MPVMVFKGPICLQDASAGKAVLHRNSLIVVTIISMPSLCMLPRSEGADLIDLATAAEWLDEDLYDGFHYTDTGSIKVADILAREMKRIIDSHR